MRKLAAFCKKIVFHPDPIKRTIITFIYCGVGIFFNFFVLQVFCMPVMYASVMCIVFYIALLAFPFIHNKVLKTIACFLLGTGVPICIYCAWFLASGNGGVFNYVFFFFAILLLGAGLLGFIPFYLLLHIRRYYKAAVPIGRRSILAGVVVPFVALAIYLSAFRSYLVSTISIQDNVATKDEFVRRLPNSYFTERILGLCWKYHTCIDFVYDGWRPPLHDPFLIIGLTYCSPAVFHHSNTADNFWPVYYWEAIKYYHRKFPGRRLKENCPCSYSRDGKDYLTDPLDSALGAH